MEVREVGLLGDTCVEMLFGTRLRMLGLDRVLNANEQC